MKMKEKSEVVHFLSSEIGKMLKSNYLINIVVVDLD